MGPNDSSSKHNKRWLNPNAKHPDGTPVTDEEFEQAVRKERARFAAWDKELNDFEARVEAQYGPVPQPPDHSQETPIFGSSEWFARAERGRPVTELPWGEGYIAGTCNLFGDPVGTSYPFVVNPETGVVRPARKGEPGGMPYEDAQRLSAQIRQRNDRAIG